jgi:hypothetical protein
MIANPRRPRVPLRSALRTYWPFLAVLLLTSAMIFTYLGAKEHASLMTAIFFVGAFVAMVPWLFFDAPYSFWVVACVLWFCSPFIFAIGSVVFHAIRGTLGAP